MWRAEAILIGRSAALPRFRRSTSVGVQTQNRTIQGSTVNTHNSTARLCTSGIDRHVTSSDLVQPAFWRDMYASSHAVNLLAQARVLLPSNGNPAYSETDKNHTFRWTTGNNPALSHCKVIGTGGAGEVHEVSPNCIH